MNRLQIGLFDGPVIFAPGDSVLLPVPEDERPLRGDAGWIDWRLCGRVSEQLLSGFVRGEVGEVALLPAGPPLEAGRLLLAGLGPGQRMSGRALMRMTADAVERLRSLRCKAALLALPEALTWDEQASGLFRGFVRAIAQSPPETSLCVVVPDAAARTPALEVALNRTVEDAETWNVHLDVGWIAPDDPEAPESPA